MYGAHYVELYLNVLTHMVVLYIQIYASFFMTLYTPTSISSPNFSMLYHVVPIGDTIWILVASKTAITH